MARLGGPGEKPLAGGSPFTGAIAQYPRWDFSQKGGVVTDELAVLLVAGDHLADRGL